MFWSESGRVEFEKQAFGARRNAKTICPQVLKFCWVLRQSLMSFGSHGPNLYEVWCLGSRLEIHRFSYLFWRDPRSWIAAWVVVIWFLAASLTRTYHYLLIVKRLQTSSWVLRMINRILSTAKRGTEDIWYSLQERLRSLVPPFKRCWRIKYDINRSTTCS